MSTNSNDKPGASGAWDRRRTAFQRPTPMALPGVYETGVDDYMALDGSQAVYGGQNTNGQTAMYLAPVPLAARDRGGGAESTTDDVYAAPTTAEPQPSTLEVKPGGGRRQTCLMVAVALAVVLAAAALAVAVVSGGDSGGSAESAGSSTEALAAEINNLRMLIAHLGQTLDYLNKTQQDHERKHQYDVTTINEKFERIPASVLLYFGQRTIEDGEAFLLNSDLEIGISNQWNALLHYHFAFPEESFSKLRLIVRCGFKPKDKPQDGSFYLQFQTFSYQTIPVVFGNVTVRVTPSQKGLKTVVSPWIETGPGDVAQYSISFYGSKNGTSPPITITSISMQIV